MSFFKKYNGTTNLRLARVETAIWVLIYGGLLCLLVGLSMSQQHSGTGFGPSMKLAYAAGTVALGVYLIGFLCSFALPEPPEKLPE